MLNKGREGRRNAVFGNSTRWTQMASPSKPLCPFSGQRDKVCRASPVISRLKCKSDLMFSHQSTLFPREWNHHSFCWSQQKSEEAPSHFPASISASLSFTSYSLLKSFHSSPAPLLLPSLIRISPIISNSLCLCPVGSPK